jgi:hypothetical protein
VSDHIADIIQEVIYSNGIPNRKYLFCLLGSESRYKNYPNPVRRILDSVINDTRDDKNKLTVRDFRNVFATRLIKKERKEEARKRMIEDTKEKVKYKKGKDQ